MAPYASLLGSQYLGSKVGGFDHPVIPGCGTAAALGMVGEFRIPWNVAVNRSITFTHKSIEKPQMCCVECVIPFKLVYTGK